MLRLFETSSSTFFYHLREDNDDPKFGGTVATTLCGKEVRGWDTKINAKTWGLKSHLNERHCPDCDALKESTP